MIGSEGKLGKANWDRFPPWGFTWELVVGTWGRVFSRPNELHCDLSTSTTGEYNISSSFPPFKFIISTFKDIRTNTDQYSNVDFHS